MLCSIVQAAFDQLMSRLRQLDGASVNQITQMVVDVSALEESMRNFLSLQTVYVKYCCYIMQVLLNT